MCNLAVREEQNILVLYVQNAMKQEFHLKNERMKENIMTFKEMIFKGLCDGTVKIISNPNDDWIACQIGDFLFYFIGSKDEDLTRDEMYKSYTKEQLTEMIYSMLQDMKKNKFDEVEYYKYKSFLEEKYANNKEKYNDMNMILWNELKKHRGHKVSIVSYGDWDNPADICLECEDCGEVVLDAELYTLCARGDA